MKCTIRRTIDSRHRKDGSLSWFKGVIDFEGVERTVSLSTKLTDEGHEQFYLDGDYLGLAPRHVREVRRSADISAMHKRAEEKRLEPYADILGSLPPLEAVSDKQQAFAEEVRLGVLTNGGVLEKIDNLPVDQRSLVHDTILNARDARFWLDNRGAYRVLRALADIARPAYQARLRAGSEAA